MNVTTITVSTDQPCAVTEQENINVFVPQRTETVCVEESPLTIVIPQGVSGADGQDGQGVPPGGDAGQILAKIDGTDYNTEWIDAPTGGDSTRVLIPFKNQSGATITKGTLVQFDGTLGNSGIIKAKPWVPGAPGHLLMGFATADVLQGGDGFAMDFGEIEQLNTTGADVGETWADGDLLYPHPTQVGKVTKVQPTAPALKMEIAAVVHAHTNGSIQVRMTPGHTIASANDATVTSPTAGQALLWSGTVWRNETLYQQSVTYAQLVALIAADGLTPGKRYLISDFETRFYKLDGSLPIAGSETGGGVEGIIVTASTANTLSAVAESIVHPGDILYYDWNPANYISDPFYSLSGTIVPGWKGVITRRIDTVNNNNCTFDFRAMLYREFAVTERAYNAGTVYNVGSLARFKNELYLCIVNGTVGIAPTSTAYWVKLFAGIHTSTNKHWLKSSVGMSLTVADTENFDFVEALIGANGASDFVDRPAFVAGCKNITMEGQPGYLALNTCIKGVTDSAVIRAKNSSFGPASYSSVGVSESIFSINGLSLNVGGGCNTIIIGTVASFINIKDQSNNTVFGSACSVISCSSTRTVFGELSGSFEAENISDCVFPQIVLSKISAGAQSNQSRSPIERAEIGPGMIGCLFLAGVIDVKIGAFYQSNRHNSALSSSSFGNNCQGNRFDGVTRCRIGDGFSNNTIPGYIEGVIGSDNFNDDDYSSATVIYQQGTKQLITNSNGDKVIVYIDSSNVQQITSNLT